MQILSQLFTPKTKFLFSSKKGIFVWVKAFGGIFFIVFLSFTISCNLNKNNNAISKTMLFEPDFMWPATASELPLGNKDVGEQLYLQFNCNDCHGFPHQQPQNSLSAPWLGGLRLEQQKIPQGYELDSYVYESILTPDAYLNCDNYNCEGQDLMPNNLFKLLTIQDMSDIMAYLLEKEEFEGYIEIKFPELEIP